MAALPPRRDWTPRETRLVAEYVVRAFPDARVILHPRLGPPLPRSDLGRFSEDEARVVGHILRRYADAIVVERDRLLVVEAKIVLEPGVISQLLLYLELVKTTPELEPYGGRPVEGLIVCAVLDEATAALAVRSGLRVVTYRPPWIDEYLAVLAVRDRRGARQPVPGLTEEEPSG